MTVVCLTMVLFDPPLQHAYQSGGKFAVDVRFQRVIFAITQ